MISKTDVTKIAELVLPQGMDKVLVSQLPELLATAFFPEPGDDVSQAIDSIAKVSVRRTPKERIILGLKQLDAPDEQLQRPLGYCRIQDLPTRKRNTSGSDLVQLHYVRVPAKDVRPLDTNDWNELKKVWANLPALHLPIADTKWLAYLIGYLNSSILKRWREQWNLCMNVIDLNQERNKGWDAAVIDNAGKVRLAIEQGQLRPRSFTDDLPVESLSNNPSVEFYVTLNDLRHVEKMWNVKFIDGQHGHETNVNMSPSCVVPDTNDWIAKCRAIADRIGLEIYTTGRRHISGHFVSEAVADELGADESTWGLQGPRSSENVRTKGLRGWKFKPPPLANLGEKLLG